jgi:hypothetical protein
VLERADHDEETEEEEERSPVELRERFLDGLRREQEHHRCADEGDRRGLEVDQVLSEEGEHGHREHRAEAPEERGVADGRGRVECGEP